MSLYHLPKHYQLILFLCVVAVILVATLVKPISNTLNHSTLFEDKTALVADNPAQQNYGMAVTDVDGDKKFEVVVAGYGYPNMVLKWNGTQYVNIADATLADAKDKTLSLAACDIDGDGQEELFLNNVDGDADKLLHHTATGWVNVLPNQAAASIESDNTSVHCLDRTGNGSYGFLVGENNGPLHLYEMNPAHVIQDVASLAGLAKTAFTQGIVAAPFFSSKMDVYVTNEHGPNFLFRNKGDGTYEEVAKQYGVDDPTKGGQGIAVLDANEDGKLDIAYGNTQGATSLYQQGADSFTPVTNQTLDQTHPTTSVIAADFDNDGHEELFFHTLDDVPSIYKPQRGTVVPYVFDKPPGFPAPGSGCAIGDFNGNGRLEVLLSYGADHRQLSLYEAKDAGANWLRIIPYTQNGAPARGATVKLTMNDGTVQLRTIDASSSYLCATEPVAHFGLGPATSVQKAEVSWPSGATVSIDHPAIDSVLDVPYPNK